MRAPQIFLLLSTAALMNAAGTDKVDIYTPTEVQSMTQKLAQKNAPFASASLEKYGNHYTMLAHREATGSAEIHEKEADLFVVTEGDATIVTGGTLVSPHTEKPGEIRGTSIKGGENHPLPAGSIIHIPAGVPHQLQIQKCKPFTYFVMKVIE
jgi:mannose-6-phosphate isomerase-like protein (cupin superfamily)